MRVNNPKRLKPYTTRVITKAGILDWLSKLPP